MACTKVISLRNIYKRKGKEGMVLERQNNISWLLEGRTYVNQATVNGVVDIVINDEGTYLIANNIEAQRMIVEEFSYDVTVKEYPWYKPSSREQLIIELTGGQFVTDSECENEIISLRLVMTPEQKITYYQLGEDTADAIQKTCMSIASGMTEFKVAGIMAKKCMEKGIEPIITLVASDERIKDYRHPLPTAKIIDKYVMMVIGGRRNGQIVCITRFVAFSELSEEIKHRRDAVLNLDALLFQETRPGNRIDEIFNTLIQGYSTQGYPDEWKLHHQGGLTGYNSREYKANFDIDIVVKSGQVYAWNPSITGFKAEDTFIVEDEKNVILTHTPELPYKIVEYGNKELKRPDILVRRKLL